MKWREPTHSRSADVGSNIASHPKKGPLLCLARGCALWHHCSPPGGQCKGGESFHRRRRTTSLFDHSLTCSGYMCCSLRWRCSPAPDPRMAPRC